MSILIKDATIVTQNSKREILEGDILIQENKIEEIGKIKEKAEFVIDASKKNVVVIDRREFDKYLARLALKFGADIKIGEKVIDIKSNQVVKIITNKRETSSHVFINAGGISSLRDYRKGVMQAAQYEVYGSWIDKETVELFINNKNI